MPQEQTHDTTAAPDHTAASRKPSRGWYGLSFVIMLIGVAAFTASINVTRMKLHAVQEQMQKVVVPGTASLSFDEPGRFLIYYEKVGQHDGRTFNTVEKFPSLPKLSVQLLDSDDHPIEVSKAHVSEARSEMYDHGRANSEFAFDIPRPGDYTLITAHANDNLDDELLVAVGPSLVQGVTSDWTGPFGGAAVLAFSFVIAAVTTLLTWTLRSGKVTRRDD